MNFTHTKFSLSRPIGDYTKIQILYGSIIRNRKSQVKKLNNKAKKYLNVGCGPNLNENYVNLDYQWRPSLDLCWDLTRGLPLESNSMKGVYTEHCLEHITFSQTQEAIKEFFRILTPGGSVRIIVPDAELYIDLYIKNRNGEDVIFPFVTEENYKLGFTPIMSINRVFRNHGHLFAYDFECLSLMLRQAGFSKIVKESYQKGRDSSLLIDSESRKIESVYVEATK